MQTVFNTSQSPVLDNSSQVKQFLKYIERDASQSQDLVDMGIHTKLAQSISEFYSNPIAGLANTYLSVAENLYNILTFVVIQFLKANKNIVFKAYSASKTDLDFYIILNSDTTKNREVFFDFVRQYELLGIENKMPIFFSFLPKKAERIMGAETEISFL